ncbi:MAG: DUF1501 domain-containing protein [Cystobacterineae bacterium]|nr:DUF1501 domain-containing protein [Cystobacterineae bacterium]
MDRRSFLKAAGSFAVLLPWAGSKAFAQSQPRYGGPFLICINAEGGWDTTMFFDPKPGNNDKGARMNNSYTTVGTRGPFSYAPVSFRVDSANENSLLLHSPEGFLNNHANRLLLLNGVDTTTNAHSVGKQTVWGGHPTREYPSVGALLAIKASQDFELPCAYLSDSGGYLKTQGLVPLTRITSTSTLRNIAYDRRFPASATNLLSEQTSQRIQEAQEKRIEQLAQQLHMPESKEALAHYNKAMLAKNGLAPWMESLPSTSINLEQLRPGAGTVINPVLQQAELALYGFRAGTVVSASLSLGAFDTHANNDALQRIYLGRLFVLIEYILNKIAEPDMELADKVYVVVGSDFARTPAYNTNSAGKDHWNATSLMVFGPNIEGNRVLGRTAANQHPAHVNPQNPSQPLSEESGGIVLKPSHLHHELRRVLGLQNFNSSHGLLDTPVSLL